MSKTMKHSLIFIGFLLCIRLFAMWLVPLTDTTEARYGEIARKMVETGDWVTLWHDYGVPFWAKPPLSTWMSALSMQVFGVNEGAARLPAVLLAVAVIALMWRFMRAAYTDTERWLAVVILSSMALFYVVSGTVMTDMPLLFTCTLTLVAFWLALEESSTFWGYLFFTGLGLSLLSKGVAAIVLALLPIFCWMVWAKQWRKVMQGLPWRGGVILTLLIGLPWYVLAEIKTPGFLQYFIIGEHFSRFMDSGWQGDLYGSAHNKALGTIWLFLLVDAFPWVLVVIPVVLYQRLRLKQASTSMSAQQQYLWCWFLTPLVFFSFAHNIILTYTLTALPGFALLVSRSIRPLALHKEGIRPWVFVAGLAAPLMLMAVMAVSHFSSALSKHSGKEITRLFEQKSVSPARQLNYIGKRLYSMDFYNGGKEERFETVAEALEKLAGSDGQFLALTNDQLQALNDQQRKQLQLIDKTPTYHLYQIHQEGQP